MGDPSPLTHKPAQALQRSPLDWIRVIYFFIENQFRAAREYALWLKQVLYQEEIIEEEEKRAKNPPERSRL